MSDFTPKNDILNLSPSASKTSSNNAFNKTSKVKENGKETDEKENHTNSGNDNESFLNSLIKSIDETNQFLPDHMKISQKEVVNEAMSKLQQGSFDENDKISIFESVSFMQILSMLDKLKVGTSDVKLANLSTQLSTLVKTEANLNALKGAKNLSELLDMAKDMGLNVKNIKVDRLLDLKATFPNLDKADFFKGAVDNVFKEVIKNKIANINKNLTHLNQQSTHTTNIKNLNNENNISLLSKTLQNLDSIMSDKKTELPKNKNAEHSENKTNLVKDLTKNIKNDENLMHLKETNEDNKQEKEQKLTTKNNIQEQPILKAQVPLSKKDFKENLKEDNQTQIKENKQLKTQKLEQEKIKSEDKNTFAKNETNIDKTKILDKNDLIKDFTKKETPKEIVKKEFAKESLKESPKKELTKESLKESPKEEKNLNPKEILKEVSKDIVEKTPKENLNNKKSENKIKNSNPLKNMQNLNASKENIETKNTKNTNTLVQNLQNRDFKDVLNQNTQNTLNNNANILVKENTLKESKEPKEHKNLTENKINTNIEQKLNTELLKSQSVNEKNNENFSDLNNKENNKDFNENRQNHTQKDDNLDNLNSLLKDLSKVSQNQSKNPISPKETLQHFSQDLKEAMANYKAPITKLSITLNPSNLGEVEVTLVQRGSNLHINFNSNTNAMNLFIQHQAEFKNSLVNMGFTGLEMNFSDQSKKEQNQNKNRSGYGFKEALEGENESEKVNLELVLARYF